MIFLLDNYDSFTYNLVQRLGEIDPTLDIRVARNDKTTPAAIESLGPSHVIVSPGPCTPNEAGISVECVRHFAGRVPLYGGGTGACTFVDPCKIDVGEVIRTGLDMFEKEG